MSTFLTESPARTLECITEKFVVDFAQGIDMARDPWRSPQGKAYYQRLKETFIGQNRLRQWAMDDALLDNLEVSLAWLGQLVGKVAKSHLATTLIHERISQVNGASLRVASYSAEARGQLALLKQQLEQRLLKAGKQFEKNNLYLMATLHCEQVFARWGTGHFQVFSPAGRCYVALQELRWGAFGDALRHCRAEQAEQLLEQVRSLAINRLAVDIDASTRTRHFYHQWLSMPSAAGLMEHKDALIWLGNGSDSERQPVSYSVTQTWQGIALGMPRICSAMRLGSAMVDEIFI